MYVNAVGVSRAEFVRILHYLRLAFQRIIASGNPDQAILQKIYTVVDAWLNHFKGASQCKVLMQQILMLFPGCR